jgi:protoporphyrinogen oxidase
MDAVRNAQEAQGAATVDDLSQPGGDFDAIVLGAGISGLVATSIMLQEGCRRILVADEYSHVGGNHIDATINGYTFDVGSLIFQDDSPLLRHFPEILPNYVPIKPTWGRLNPQGVVTSYPVSLKADVIDAGPVEWCRVLSSLLWSRLFHGRMRNAREFARYWLGARFLHRSGLSNYMERFYGSPPEKIDIRFAEKRMLGIKEQALLRTHVRRLLKPAVARPTNTQLARPRTGFAALYRPAVEGLQARGARFVLGARLRGLRKDGDKFALETGSGVFTARRVVSTIPLDNIRQLCGLGREEKLATVTLITLFYSFSGDRRFKQSVLYNFSYLGAWKRLTVYSDFYGRHADREYFAVEVNAQHVSGDAAVADEDFQAHVAKNGLFQGNLRFEGSHALAHAYPIYVDNAQDNLAMTLAALRAFGIESIGRQGAFDYQPTARDTTLKAEAALDRKT